MMLEIGKVYRWHFVWMDPDDKTYVGMLVRIWNDTGGRPIAVDIDGESYPWHQIRSWSLHHDQETPTQ